MPIQYIDEDVIEIVDKGKKFHRILSSYLGDGWKTMFYESIVTKKDPYYQAVMSKNEDVYFKHLSKNKGLSNNATY